MCDDFIAFLLISAFFAFGGFITAVCLYDDKSLINKLKQENEQLREENEQLKAKLANISNILKP